MEYKCILVALFLLNVVCFIRQTSSEKTQKFSVDQDRQKNDTRSRLKRSEGGIDTGGEREFIGVAVALESTLESPAHATYWFGGVFVRIAKDAIMMHRETFQRSFKFLSGGSYVGHLVFEATTFDLATYPKYTHFTEFRRTYDKGDFVAGRILSYPNSLEPLPDRRFTFEWEHRKDKNLTSNCHLYAYNGENLVAKKRKLVRYNARLAGKFSPSLDTVQLKGGTYDLCPKDHDLGSPVMCYSNPNERGQMTFYAIAKEIYYSNYCVNGFVAVKIGAIYKDLVNSVPPS